MGKDTFFKRTFSVFSKSFLFWYRGVDWRIILKWIFEKRDRRVGRGRGWGWILIDLTQGRDR
jgi:hypothetical protein